MPQVPQTAKVLVIIPSLEVGGAEMDLLRVLPRIDRSRFKVDVWTFQYRGELADRMSAAGIRVIDPAPWTPDPSFAAGPQGSGAGLGRITALVRLFRNVAAGARLLRAHNYDVIHSVLPSSYLIAVLACTAALRGRVLMSRLSQNWYQSDHPLFGFVERQILHRTAAAAIGNAKMIVDELRAEGIDEHKLSLVRNGLDIEQFDRSLADRNSARKQLLLPAEAFVLSAVANLHRYKGYDDLIAALASAQPRLPDEWYLLVAGSDREGNLERLQQAARLKGLEKNVRFLGPRSDVPLILSAADVHVTASHSEGLPNNVIEAMFARLPVIGTAVGGIPELVEDGKTGLLVASKDSEGLAQAIVELAIAPTKRIAMGELGRAVAERRFDVERTVIELSAIYEDLVLSHRENRTYRSRQQLVGRIP